MKYSAFSPNTLFYKRFSLTFSELLTEISIFQGLTNLIQLNLQKIKIIVGMGTVTCCQNQVHKEQFKEYCLNASSLEYKTYFAAIQHEEYNLSPQLKTQKKQYKCGNWKKGETQTGKGVIFAPEKFYYQGQIVDGVAKGQGKIIWPNKSFYNGNVSENKAQGQGEIHLTDKNIILKGHWEDGYPRINEKMNLSREGKPGSITFIDFSGSKIADYFKGILIVRIDFGNGVKYQGEIKQKNNIYSIDGTGTISFSDGSKYDGQFKSGKMDGKGRYTWGQTGHWFEGIYKYNIRQGKGTYYYNINEFQTGEWKGGVLIKDQSKNTVQQEKTSRN